MIGAKQKLKVVHITPHLGGGVGACLEEFFRNTANDADVEQNLLCLDWCVDNFQTISQLLPTIHGLAVRSPNEIRELLLSNDLIVLHYWNHPLMSRALHDGLFDHLRVLVWCHNSGIQEPHILPSILSTISNCIAFTSPCSEAAPNLRALIGDINTESRCVLPIPALGRYRSIGLRRRTSQDVRRLLYVGTVSTSKMHPDSPKIFAQLSKLGFEIQIVGGPDHFSLYRAVQSYGGQVEVFGQVDDPADFFANADIFIYPLRPAHYGTGEIVLMEAITSGLPVVAFNNLPETYALQEMRECRLVSTVGAFVEAVSDTARTLFRDFAVPNHLSQEAHERLDSGIVVQKLKSLMVVTASLPPGGGLERPASQVDVVSLFARFSFFDTYIYQQCVANMDISSEVVLTKIKELIATPDGFRDWTALSKGTPAHYLRYFPSDIRMQLVVNSLSTLSHTGVFN